MALKGHTRIELTNVETGEVEVHEDDNMVTNALSKLLGNYGWFANNALSYAIAGSDDDGVIKKLTCGLQLFDSAIEENPEIINAPAGVSVVGCGSATAYNGANTMAGSYNETESGWTDDGGYKHVWDFSTSQANGEIACASLTTNAGGKITEGTFPYASDYFYKVGTKTSDEEMFLNENPRPSWYMSFETFNSHYGCYFVMFADGINNRIITPLTYEEVCPYKHSGANTESYENFKKSVFYKKSIDLALYRFGFTNFSIFDSTKESRKTKLLEVKTVEMPDGLKAIFTQEMLDDTSYYWKVGSVSDENNIYIILSAKQDSSIHIKVGQTFYIWEINAITFESKYYEFYNALDEEIRMYDLDYNKIYNFLSICDDYVLCVGESSSCVYIINKNNSYDFEKVTYPDGSQLRKLRDTQQPVFNNCGKFIFQDSEDPYKVVDPVIKKAMYKNKKLFNNCAGNVLKVKGTHYFCESGGISSGKGGIALCLDPTLLVTINNLETPVQKTSAQTMKVTYVLTQE